MKITRLVQIAIAASLVLPLTGCWWDTETADVNGLRVYAYESATFVFDKFPVAGVYDVGSQEDTGGTGGSNYFSGSTGSGGYDDHYGINLGTTWAITWNWSLVLPDCGVDLQDGVYLDPSGDFVSETCISI